MPSCPSDREQKHPHQLELPTQSIADLCVAQPREVTTAPKSHLNRRGPHSVHEMIRGVLGGLGLAVKWAEKKYRYVRGIGMMHSEMTGSLFNHSVFYPIFLADIDRTFNCTNNIFTLRDISASLAMTISQSIVDPGLL